MKRIITILSVFLLCVSLLNVNVIKAEEETNVDDITEFVTEESEYMDETENADTNTSDSEKGARSDAEPIQQMDDLHATSTDGTAYAVLTSTGDFIFFRSNNSYSNNDDATQTVSDIYNNSYTGIVYTDIEMSSYTTGSKVPWYPRKNNVKRVYVANNQSIKPISMAHWFYFCSHMTSFSATGFDTSAVTSMYDMFCGCSGLKQLDLNGFNTSRVTDMGFMFYGCRSLQALDLSTFNTSKVTSMSYMFYNCASLTSLILSGFVTSKVTLMLSMFEGCTSLTTLNISSFNTSRVYSMEKMFENCSSLASVMLGSSFTKWTNEAYLPSGTWKNTAKNITKTETELYEQYPGNASAWSGTWTKEGSGPFVPVSDVYLDWSELLLLVGETYCLTATVYPDNATNKTLKWSSSDPSVASVSSTGLVTALFDGITEITATTTDGTNLTTQCTVEVYSTHISSLSLNKTTLSMFADQTEQLVATILPANATNKTLKWSSSDSSVASVSSSGLVTALSEGVAVITAATTDGSNLSASCTVTVYNSISSSGTTYAILTYAGDLIFFRSKKSYNNETTNSVYINGTVYTGTVYNKIESESNNLGPWTGYEANRIKRVYVADGFLIKPQNTAGWFKGCGNIASIDFSGIDTSNVTNMSSMFADCSFLSSLDLSDLDTSNVKSMSGMFSGCTSLTSLNLGNFDTSNVQIMFQMFYNCTSMTSLNLSNFDTSNVTNMSGMFRSCSSMTSLNLNNFNTSNVTSMEYMFYDCSSLSSLDLSDLDTSNVKSMSGMFSGCTSLTSLNLSNFNTANVTDMSNMFYNCTSLTSLNLSNFKTPNVRSMGYMFSGCTSLTSLNLSNFNTTNVTDMSGMFHSCSSLSYLDLSDFDNLNVKFMSNMFYNCTSLTSLNLSNFKTPNVRSMGYMFCDCFSLKSLDLSDFDTSNVESMDSMFYSCTSLTSLNLSNFKTPNITNMDYLFYGCSSLMSLNLSNFITSNVSFMRSSFDRCTSLILIVIGPGFTRWSNSASLPRGTWTNNDISLSKTETELYKEYPSHASEWAGTWTRKIEEDSDYFRISDVSKLSESIKVADELKKNLNIQKFENIIIAKDSDFADALSGSYLAVRKQAPILLVGNSSFSDAYNYIYNNMVANGTIYILGAESAVPNSFEDGFDGTANIKRLAGSSRYLTNLEILKEAGMTSSGDIFVITGSGFADSLSSAAIGLPILMVDNNSTSLKNSQKKWLQANVKGRIYILGDENAVSKKLEKALRSYGSITRIGGTSRWDTTKQIAETFFSYPEYVILATGNDFADGLIASPLAYTLKSPLLLCASNKTSWAKNYVSSNSVSKAYIIGSKDYISDEAARKILLIDDDVIILER